MAKNMERIQNNNILRKHNKKLRDELSPDDRHLLSQQIIISLKALLESDFKRANIFLCFYPIGSEVDLLPLYKMLLDAGKQLYFPVSDIDTHKLIFKKITNLSKDFHLGAYNISEPDYKLSNYKYEDDTIVFTPGLVFDSECNRLGYGAGYYDRFFHNESTFTKIGICFDEQINESIIPEEHDIKMDYIVTDKRIITRRDAHDTNRTCI